jgi:hypothetical protein
MQATPAQIRLVCIVGTVYLGVDESTCFEIEILP